MANGTFMQALRAALASVLRQRQGTAAVEFSLLLPVLLLIYFGGYDITQAVIVSRKAGVASQTVSELIAQQSTSTPLTATQVSSILAASTATLAPFSTTVLTTTVSAVDLKTRSNNTCCDATVRWTYTQGGTLRPCGVTLTQVPAGTTPSATTILQSIATPPSAILATGNQPTAVIVADVSYAYSPLTPSIDHLLSTTIRRTVYAFPRSSGQVTLASPVTAPTGQSGTVC